MIKRGESLAVALLSLLFILVLISACSANKEIKQDTLQEGEQDIHQAEPKVKIVDENADLRKFTLDTKDLPEFNVISEASTEKNARNQSAIYDSVSSLKKEFSREIMMESIPKNYNEVNKGGIGDESYIFYGELFGVKRTSVWFSRQNVLVKLSFVGFGADEAFSYAQIIE